MIKEDTVTRLLNNENESGELTRKTVTLSAEVGAVQGTLHLPGVRDAYRWRLEQVVSLGQTSSIAEFCEGMA